MPVMTHEETAVREMMPETMAVIDRMTSNRIVMSKIPASSSTGVKVQMCPKVFESDGKLVGAFVVLGGCADAVTDTTEAFHRQGDIVRTAAPMRLKPTDDFRIHVEGAMGPEPDHFNVFVEMPVSVERGSIMKGLKKPLLVEVASVRFHAHGLRDADVAKVVEEAIRLRVMGRSPRELTEGLRTVSESLGAERMPNGSMGFQRSEPEADAAPRM